MEKDLRVKSPTMAQDNQPDKLPALAPPWLALVTAWAGLAVLVASVLLMFLPGSIDPRQELEHFREYSLADRFLPIPIYGIAGVLFCGTVVLWQMRRHPPSLALHRQRIQAWVGIVLALAATIVVYVWVAINGP